MAVRPIVKLGDPVLGQLSQPVTSFDAELRELVQDMIETMYAAPGVGLAAVQVGIPLRVAVVDVSVGRNPEDLIVLVNPSITLLDGRQDAEEGCLSVPGFIEPVQRAERVRVEARDLNGERFERTGEGLLARAFQHELDHMDGKLFLSHLNGLKRRLIQRRVDKLRRTGRWS